MERFKFENREKLVSIRKMLGHLLNTSLNTILIISYRKHARKARYIQYKVNG